MITITRRLISEHEVEKKLAALASRYDIQDTCYDESMADRMSDFDAMKWTALWDMRKTARQRNLKCGVPPIVRSLYEKSSTSRSVELKNKDFTLDELAA